MEERWHERVNKEKRNPGLLPQPSSQFLKRTAPESPKCLWAQELAAEGEWDWLLHFSVGQRFTRIKWMWWKDSNWKVAKGRAWEQISQWSLLKLQPYPYCTHRQSAKERHKQLLCEQPTFVTLTPHSIIRRTCVRERGVRVTPPSNLSH